MSGLSQTSTTETNRTAANAIADRRSQETQRSEAADQSRARASEERAAAERDRRRAPASSRSVEARDEAVRARRTEARASAARARQAEARVDAARARKAEKEEAAAMARRAEVRAEAARLARAEAREDAAEARRLSQRRREQPPRQETRREAFRGEADPAARGIVRKGYDPVPVLPPVPLVEAPRYGIFAQGFGDFEQRNGRASSTVQYTDTIYPLQILQKSTTRTVGFLGGLDLTVRNAFEPGDGVILGLLTGYTETSVDIQTRIGFAPSTGLANGAASTKVSLSGPSVGVFATYFTGGFSIDQTFKADFFGLDQAFTESASFVGLPSSLATITGTGRTGVTQLSAIGNANYRVYATDTVWIEPTVGYQYTHSSYEQSAAQLGLRDGYLIRIQGGARLGFDTYFGASRLTTSLTGLAYENVVIDGGFIQAGAFGSNVIALNDEGKLRGQGILTFALDHGNGVASFIQGDVRGGDRYFAAGGRAGLRYQW